MGYLFVWLLLAFIVSAIGSGKQIGYWKTFLLCLFLSPLLGMIIALCSTSIPDYKEYRCPNCEYKTTAFTYYCPRCGKDNEGHTLVQNQERFN